MYFDLVRATHLVSTLTDCTDNGGKGRGRGGGEKSGLFTVSGLTLDDDGLGHDKCIKGCLMSDPLPMMLTFGGESP